MVTNSNLPQAVCSVFATLPPPPQSSGQELESPVFGLVVSPGHGRQASRCPLKQILVVVDVFPLYFPGPHSTVKDNSIMVSAV